jgi:WD40 repeat protein
MPGGIWSDWFTLWQPGLTHERSVYTWHASTTHSWSTSFATWSPDGRYLITDLSFWGGLDSAESIAASNQFVTVISLDQAARLHRNETAPPRDIATTRDKGADGLTNQCAALLQAVETPLAFGWSPNGRVLADYGAGNGVDLYDCPTGHKLTSFTLRSQYPAPSADAVTLRWSPDGSHLLLSSVAFGLVSLWKFAPQ